MSITAKHILLVIASNGFQPMEYQVPYDVLTKAGVRVSVASDKTGTAVAAYDTNKKVNVTLALDDVNVSDYAGIFFVGGPGALDLLDNKRSHRIIREAQQKNIPFGAICISPRILAHAGVLKGKNATGWDEDGELAGVLKQAGAHYFKADLKAHKNTVIVDGNIVTAQGPLAAQDFAQAIITLLTR